MIILRVFNGTIFYDDLRSHTCINVHYQWCMHYEVTRVEFSWCKLSTKSYINIVMTNLSSSRVVFEKKKTDVFHKKKEIFSFNLIASNRTVFHSTSRCKYPAMQYNPANLTNLLVQPSLWRFDEVKILFYIFLYLIYINLLLNT